MKKGEFELADSIRGVMDQLQVREKVAGLLEDRGEESRLVRVKDRAMSSGMAVAISCSRF